MNWIRASQMVLLTVAVAFISAMVYQDRTWLDAAMVVIVFVITFYIGFRHGEEETVNGIMGTFLQRMESAELRPGQFIQVDMTDLSPDETEEKED